MSAKISNIILPAAKSTKLDFGSTTKQNTIKKLRNVIQADQDFSFGNLINRRKDLGGMFWFPFFLGLIKKTFLRKSEKCQFLGEKQLFPTPKKIGEGDM